MILLSKRKDGFLEMKNKMAALLAALLLCLSLLPSQSIAASDPTGNNPSSISEQGELESPKNSEIPDKPASQEHSASQANAQDWSMDPGLSDAAH